jgi:EAL domain-containing protein (putative c-di-GMP-specific phosphodiesterase class I)/GGDEF domain-containing protein
MINPGDRALGGLIDVRRLYPVFQPILDLQQGQYVSCEALLRGPEGSALHSPEQLFAAAAALDCVYDLEWLAVELALEEYSRQRAPLRLFLNMSAGCLHNGRERLQSLRQQLFSLGIPPSRIVIELTESECVTEFPNFKQTLADIRRMGIRIAMDDLGEGFSNLRMWSEVRPEFVKIDRHFITDIHRDPLKFHFVRAMHEIADACGSILIAEGVETEDELNTLRKLDIPLIQGYAIARPARAIALIPPELPSPGAEVIRLPTLNSASRRIPPIAQLLHEVEPLSPDMLNDAVYAVFEQHPDLQVLPVVADQRPLGVISRGALIDRFARPFRRELYGKRACTVLMDQPLCVDRVQDVQQVAQLIGSQRGASMADSFIICDQGRYLGVGYARELMAIITDLQIRAARYANPLTQLPGNVPINEHLDRLLEAGVPFMAAYCDLDAFKPFNDAYGYRRGDQVIQLVGNLLGAMAKGEDFIGHIGGDDFVFMTQASDWHARLNQMVGQFDALVREFLNPVDLENGGYFGEDRRGQPVFHPLPALSIGCLTVFPGVFRSHHEIAEALSEVKAAAKRISGSCVFVERRSYLDEPLVLPTAVPPAPTFGTGIFATA